MKKIRTLLTSIWNGQTRKNSFRNYCKHVTIIIAYIASINTAIAQNNITVQEVYYKFVVNAPEIKIPEEVTITGLVRDETGAPLANATIRSDYGKELLTDNKGAFSFALKKEQVTAQNIYAAYNGLVTGVRTYQPAMENTTYDITLYKPAVCCKIKKCEDADFKTFTINFKNNNSILSDSTKKQLDTITNSLKNCPDNNIHLTTHIVKRKSLQTSAIAQLNAIKNYLIEQNGIATDRIKTDEVIDAIENNSIEVAPE